MANTILPGYLVQWGDKLVVTFDHAGPASYTQISIATPPTGGDAINASDLGVGGFDTVDVMEDPTGTYFARAIPVYGGNGNAVPKVILQWFVSSTGAEVAGNTVLSSYTLRLRAVCV